MGGGLELGAEVTDFVIVLNTVGAVKSFMKGSNVTFGGNLSAAVSCGHLQLWDSFFSNGF